MTPNLKNVSEIVAKAIDLFYAKFEDINPAMGIIDQALRKQGVAADGITIDCIALDKKVVIVLHDDKPTSVGVALGNKAGDIHSSSEHPIVDISEDFIMKIMEEYFVANKSEDA